MGGDGPVQETRGGPDDETVGRRVSPSPRRNCATRPDDFPHIRRMRDQRFPHEIACLLPGDYFVSAEPMIAYTVLGSCIAACVRDPAAGVGGMNHFMLPAPKAEGAYDTWGASTRYGSYAMEVLINEIVKRGGQKHRLEIKLFGGGRIYDGGMDVGRHNVAWVMAYLVREGFVPAGADVGDVLPRKVYYDIQSGRVCLKKLDRLRNRTIQDREAQYLIALQRAPNCAVIPY